MRKRVEYRGLHLFAIVGLLVVFSVLGSGASASAGSPHQVKVFDSHFHVVAVFSSAKCKIGRLGFFSDAFSRGYHLEADVIPFSGFHHYPLRRGHFTPQVVILISPSGVRYASDYVPPYPVHGGGAINFTAGGTLMGVGFSPMFSRDGSDAVTLAGVVPCEYPKRKGR
jgi:hypothetical protein